MVKKQKQKRRRKKKCAWNISLNYVKSLWPANVQSVFVRCQFVLFCSANNMFCMELARSFFSFHFKFKIEICNDWMGHWQAQPLDTSVWTRHNSYSFFFFFLFALFILCYEGVCQRQLYFAWNAREPNTRNSFAFQIIHVANFPCLYLWSGPNKLSYFISISTIEISFFFPTNRTDFRHNSAHTHTVKVFFSSASSDCFCWSSYESNHLKSPEIPACYCFWVAPYTHTKRSVYERAQ